MKKLLIVLLFPITAHAEFYTGNILLNRLQSESTVEKAVALGYVMGVFDANQGATHCAGNRDITAGQIKDMARAYLENNPTTRNRTADILLGELFKKAWPCTGRNGV